MSLVLGLGLEHSCPWPRECLSSERLSLALASDFFCVLGLGLGLEPCVLDSTSGRHPRRSSVKNFEILYAQCRPAFTLVRCYARKVVRLGLRNFPLKQTKVTLVSGRFYAPCRPALNRFRVVSKSPKLRTR